MSVFRRRRDETPAAAPGAAASTAPSADSDSGAARGTMMPVARDPELGVPPFRPAPKEAPMAGASAPRPGAPPASPLAGARGAPVLAGARPAGAAAATQGGAGRAEGAERRTLVVGKGISLQGTVSDAERLVVEGTVESQMIQAAELLITHSGVFKGEVQIEDAEVAGTFDGTLTATGNLVIRATGKLLGVARCRRLQVEEGGQITGRMEMLTDAAHPAARAPVPPAMPATPGATAARSPEPAEA
ncbi:bactofilin family protein [Caldovatus aquaticus]|uniref:Polymer-forming cytoskeletal protein n=1 Tax=Caldovatus aquaticus TaxID=2865671 RepID=A0ABS7F3R4_9PROT|nr:polymer-forming cytoskeletal protein [Caldovatus aquaticus]MBW8270249.1 polymer-forming cytoskeletal protein [Caldovatus aquaticus]